MARVHIHRSRVLFEATKFREVEVTDNGVLRIAHRQDREALRLNVEVVEEYAERSHQGNVPANTLADTAHKC